MVVLHRCARLTMGRFLPTVSAMRGLTARRFCALVAPPGLRESPHVLVPLRRAADQIAPSPSRRGEKAVGVGDRGVGLVYRDGKPGSSEALSQRESETPPEGTFVVKIQPPLDVGGDSEGGAGKMTPATLLLSDKTWRFVRFVKEEDQGHTSLLRCALSEDGQVAYRYAEVVKDKELSMKVFTTVNPPSNQADW